MNSKSNKPTASFADGYITAPEEWRRWHCVCLDVETLSTAPDAVILEIGAVCFDPHTGELGPELNVEIGMREADNRLRGVDPETWAWWAERMKKGQDMPGMYGGFSLWTGLHMLKEFLDDQMEIRSAREVWAWGSDFDFPILKHALDDAQIEVPWLYGRQCDARTICRKLGVKRQGPVRHVAVEDARQEAEAVMRALAALAFTREVMEGSEA